MTTYADHAPRTIRWETAKVLDGKLRVELTAEHADSPVWKTTAQEVIDAWAREARDLPWRTVTAGNASLFVDGLPADLPDVTVVQARLEELADRVNEEIASRARAAAREEEERRRAERAARERDERLTAAFRRPPDLRDGPSGAPDPPHHRHARRIMHRARHAEAASDG